MRRIAFLAAVGALASSLAFGGAEAFTVGAVYPVGGSQGPGGLDEYRGVMLAAELANERRVAGRRVRVRLEGVESADQAPGAVRRLARSGVPVVLGSYGSTISRPAAEAAERLGRVFWETGAVGDLGMAAASGERVFRFPPSGVSLGRQAVAFARDRLLPLRGSDPRRLRHGVVFVDDVYGRAVARGALREIARSGLTPSGSFPYDLRVADHRSIVRRIARARTDVLYVVAYLEDGIALRRESVRQGLPLVASVGTSSSYCMHEFGVALGRDAVGLFASDKPDGHVLEPRLLEAEAGGALRWARERFERRYRHEMTAAALTGFAGAWALFRHVLPRATVLTPDGIARAARVARVPVGSLPNGSGLAFGATGTDNVRATSVIWEWVAPRTRAVVWPPAFATSPILPLSIR